MSKSRKMNCTKLNIFFRVIILIFANINILFGQISNLEDSCDSFVITPLQDFAINGNTGEKPQSKVWFHNNTWWAVLPNESGTKLWELADTKWVSVLHLSDSTNTRADIRAIGNVTHILLYQGWNTKLVSVEYDTKKGSYQHWSKRSNQVSIHLEELGETATIDIDTAGRMWLASDDKTEIHIRWSESPYDKWSKPITLANGITIDDICVVSTFPNGSVGVLWSNQLTKRFGFRLHVNGTSPDNWLSDEIPASSSAISWKDGMADDHINIAVASDGTLYAVIKTSYDTQGYPLIGLLVRQPNGKWDKLYNVDDEGSRGIVLLNEEGNCLMVIYSSYRDQKIVYKISNTKNILFGECYTLMNFNINNVTSTKQNYKNEIVIMASEQGLSKSVQLISQQLKD